MGHPTRFSFVVCEDVRAEQGQKISLMGVLPGTMIISKADFEKAKAESKNLKVNQLCFFFHLSEGEGKFKARMALVTPDGTVNKTEDFGEVEVTADEPLAIMLKIAPFTVHALGNYKMRLTLDDKNYEGHFRIEAGELPKQ